MRLWSLHPRYLDRQGLTGGWREALLAQAVLAGRTRGYRNHPQLVRFRAHPEPAAAVGLFLTVLADEAAERGYSFDRSRIDLPARPDRPDRPGHPPQSHEHAGRDDTPGQTTTSVLVTPGEDVVASIARIPVSAGQLEYERQHLLAKLAERTPDRCAALDGAADPQPHPLFEVVPGPVEDWERPT